ncbi:MAG: hypothetical protein JWP75_3655 [Frondihabitans sp.]|nr:hypothetical protein [Frondihabitans sp.]
MITLSRWIRSPKGTPVDQLNAIVVALAASPWALVVLALLVALDGFFPPIPSESAVVALAAIGAATGFPNPWLVLLAAAVGSFVGDNVAYLIGRRLGLSRIRWLRRPRIAALLKTAQSNLERRPASVVLTARFIPVGRVAVNMMAGASALSHRRFVILTALSGAAWAAYSILVGVVAGSWVRDNPLLGVVGAVVVALLVGVVLDRVSSRLSRRSARSAPRATHREQTGTAVRADSATRMSS